MMAAGNAEQGGGDTSVREDAAEGLLRLFNKAGCDGGGWGPSGGANRPRMKFCPDFLLEIEEAGESAKAQAENMAKAWDRKMEADDKRKWDEESKRGFRCSDIRGLEQGTKGWLKKPKHWESGHYSLEMAVRQASNKRGTGVPPPPPPLPQPQPQPQPRTRTSRRVTRQNGPPAIANLFALDDIPRTAPAAPKRSMRWRVTGPMTGCRRLALDESDIVQAKVEMGGEDALGSIGAGALGNKRRRGETGPDAIPTVAYAAGGSGLAATGARAAAGSRYGGGSGAGAGTWAGVGVGAGVGGGAGAGVGGGAGAGAGAGAGGGGGAGAGRGGGEFNRLPKRARVSGSVSASGSGRGVTDSAGGSGSGASWPGPEGASGVGGMACSEMAGKQSWRDGDDKDGGSGGWGGDGGGGGSLDGGRATAKGISAWHAQDSAS